MKGIASNVSVPASPWDMSNWFNWYSWWLPEDQAQTQEETPTEENIESIDNEIFEKEITPEEKPKPKRKRKATPKKVSTKSQDAIELVLRPTILEELEKEAIITDSTLNQVIQVILEAHIDSKDSESILNEVWKCNHCEPEKDFKDYFGFSEHFFNEHMQPGLQKISNFNKQE